jgi:hypothetical protein
VAEAVLRLLMETDVEGLIGAGRYERSGEDHLTQWLAKPAPYNATALPKSYAFLIRSMPAWFGKPGSQYTSRFVLVRQGAPWSIRLAHGANPNGPP